MTKKFNVIQPLSDICEINPSKKEIADIHEETKISFVPMSNVSDKGTVDLSEIRELREVKGGFTYFKNGDVLLAKITPCMENGKGALVNNLVNNIGFGSTEFHVLRPKSQIDSKWLYYITKAQVFRKTAEAHMTGSAGQKRVPTTFFEKYKVLVPTLESQKKIACILDKSLELINKRKEQIESCDELIKSQFIEMFGNPVTNPKGWLIERYENLCEVITDGEHSTPQRINKGIYLLSARNVGKHSLKLDDVDFIGEEEYERISKRIIPQADDILISCSGSVGRVCRVPENIKFQMVRSVAILRLTTQVNPIFFEYLVDSNYTQQQILQSINQSSQANLFQGKIRQLRAIVPPIELQKQFATFVQQVDKLKFEMQQSLIELENNFNSLMQRAFKGELFI
ncbi:MAG: Type restriction-modification system, specificity subunit [Clostridia bacterium]|jgi:type I restriction enzyme S subunit|nr:Type restriction-modification system, specificity subunit [Clostridia bacterium]